MIYLDNAATTFPKSENVYKAMDKANRELGFNTGRGEYKKAREATHIVDETKHRILELVKAPSSSKVILSPSITIALNQIINGLNIRQGDNIYVSPYEHNAVARTTSNVCNKKDANLIQLPLNEKMEIDIEKMKYMFAQKKPSVVCLIHVSNVTGYILPYVEVFEEAKRYDAITVLDTAQSLGVVEINMQNSNIDFMAFAGHKSLYGPFGIGGFIDNSNIKLDTFLVGGTGSDSLNLEMSEQIPDRYESASPNIVAIAGLNEALKEIDIYENYRIEKKLSEYLITELKKITEVTVYLTGDNTEEQIGVVSFNVEGYYASDIGDILDEEFDIAVRTGYHCAPFIHEYIGDKEYVGTVRVGIGKYNSKQDIDHMIKAIKEVVDG